ncbi:MAG: translesion error-prone DNA polymerase V autoproteolytic subunit [Candidatus Omnitrophica bacterium]|nr:translesion error-prone DNA polymerase V autoproteolytic subunit [Candidatus Omnitrophota bacterium]MBU1995811.1 translesion error-prone DNA polymerase V autoproteolytic subunit [Candidatus Omnitrophota bacterium]
MRKNKAIKEIFSFEARTKVKLPLYVSTIKAGFPSPADDYLDKKLDLNEHLIKHPAATFFVKVAGDSMINAGIFPDDILIVDRSLEARNNKIIVAILDGEFTVKRLKKYRGKISLVSENPNYEPIEVTEDRDFDVWGVVTNVIHSV